MIDPMHAHGPSVGRRRFLAWVGAGAAATAGGWTGLATLVGGDAAGAEPDDVFAPRTRGPEREARTLHFALGSAERFARDLHVSVGGTRADLTPLDDVGRRRLALANPVAARAELSRFTHSGKINVPTTRPIEVILYGTDLVTGQKVIVGGTIVHPTWAVRRVALAAHQLGVLPDLFASHAMVRALGIRPDHAPSTPREVLALGDLVDNATAIAQKIVFKHPSIMSLNSQAATVTDGIISGTPVLSGLVSAVQALLDEVGTYGQLVPMLNADGGQQLLTNPDQPTAGSAPVSTFSPFSADGTQFRGRTIPAALTRAFRENVAQSVSQVITQVEDTASLEGTSWFATTGTPPTTVPVASAPPPTSGLRFSIDESWHNGTRMEIRDVTTTQVPGENGPITVPQVTVRVYNNNEKAYALYAQFFDADTTQIQGYASVSATDLTQPFNTMLYSCPTIVGVPVYDTNWIDYEVVLPPQAVQTRLMLATMGGLSGWEQYLKDTSGNQLYAGLVMPQECTSPLVWTTVLNLAVPTMMLALDVVALTSVMGNVFSAATDASATVASRTLLQEQIGTFFSKLTRIVGIDLVAKMFTGALSAGDFGGPNKPSLVSLIIGVGVAIIGLLSVALLSRLLAALLAGTTVEKAAEAIPLVGEVLMAISVAADVAVLYQTANQVATDPWVTVHALTGVYDSKVTINRDVANSVFPADATGWTLTPQLAANDSLTAIVDIEFQKSGPVSDPFDIPVPNVPYGGLISYTITFTDQNGFTVGTGSTPWLINSDPTKPPVASITIKQAAARVDASTTFQRRFTTQYDTATSTYTWSTAPFVPGTIADQQTCDGPEDVCRAGSIAIGTATGYVGYAYQSEQGWFVRQLALSATPGAGARGIATPFAAEPVLHYDSLRANATSGQNFLLEPIAGANAYHVRQLDLTAEGLGLDSTSWGIFLDTIHGVVLHPAGFLLGYNTDSGKLHVLQLPDAGSQESLAPTATLHAGTGNATGLRPGLLQRPVDIAVALNGMVLVLEQGANRIQAFDVRANPTPYFSAGGQANASHYLPLVAENTYLGMSVDGSGFVFTLSYAGNGTDPAQYGVDVYTPTGDHVVRADGVNGASFVVDFWRTVYTQNFRGLQRTTGGTYLTPQGVAEPSVSEWIANTPRAGAG